MKFTLKNGEEVEILPLEKTKLTARQIRSYFEKIVMEEPEPFILVNEPPTLKEEEKWLKEQKQKIAKKNELMLVALKNGEIIGNSSGHRERHRNSDKVALGIILAKKYRRLGLGKKLLVELLKLIKKKLKPRTIYLNVFALNKPALALYKKLGFVEIARLPKWIKVRGKYCDFVFMVLKWKKKQS
ncbi:MAG: GNAT family protein [Candidatus Micrarchaeota archaeon]